MTTPYRIGMIGYGFMGRAHSNAWRKVANFFPELEHRPVLQAVCARDAAKAQAFADIWGYARSRPTGASWSSATDIDAVDICVPNNLHKEIALAAAASRQDDPVREAAGHGRRRGRGHGGGGRAGRRAEHGLVQLPPRARR